MPRQFLFSFVIPAYNAQLYLAEAVESVLAQSVDFAENIQIVLVNDGSDDDTVSICEGYRGRYPNNIVYIEKTHGGAGSARNARTTNGRRKPAGRRWIFSGSSPKSTSPVFR